MTADLAPALAQFWMDWTETVPVFTCSRTQLADLADEMTTEALLLFPAVAPDQVVRAWAIYSELTAADHRARGLLGGAG
jgi:hypothetical protein